MAEELLTYDEAMAEVRTFIAVRGRGRYRMEGRGWSRWRTRPQVLPRIRGAMEAMAVGHPWLEVQRQADKEQISVEKVSQEAPV